MINRGSNVLPGVNTAMDMLLNHKREFRVPVVFVTNAGNLLRVDKAKSISKKTKVEVGYATTSAYSSH